MSGTCKDVISRMQGQRLRCGVTGALLVLTLLLPVTLTGCARREPAAATDVPRKVEVSEAAARRLSDAVSKALETHGMVRLSLTEEELTSYLALNAEGTPLSQVTAWFSQGQVHLSARLRCCGAPHLRAALAFVPDGGRLQVHVTQFSLFGRPLPGFLRASIEEALNDALADASSPLQVDQVQFGERTAVILARAH